MDRSLDPTESGNLLRKISQPLPPKVLLPVLLILAGSVVIGVLQWGKDGAPWSFQGEKAKDRLGEKVFTAGDVNGDGFADVAAFASGRSLNAGAILVFHGSRRGPGRGPSFLQEGEAKGDQYAHSFGGVGDVNGDGFGDFIAAAQNFDTPNARETGKAYLYAGSKAGLRLPPAWTRTGRIPQELFGDCSSRAGDVNGDGLEDVIVGAYGSDLSRGKVHLFLGSRETFLSKEPAWTVSGEAAGDWFGYSVASAGDVNGDGRPDIVIGAKMARHGTQGKVGKVYVFHGNGKGLSPGPDWSVAGEKVYDMFGWRAIGAGDVDGDGFCDVIASSYGHDGIQGPDHGKVYLYRGAKEGLSREQAWSSTGEAGGAMVGYSIGSGDLDGDGFSDVVVGAPGQDKVHLFRGSRQGLPTVPSLTLKGESGRFGSYVGFAGDVDGDGFPDLLVGAPAFHGKGGESAGKAYLFYGAKGLRIRSIPGKTGP
jgi:hypothetical protein